MGKDITPGPSRPFSGSSEPILDLSYGCQTTALVVQCQIRTQRHWKFTISPSARQYRHPLSKRQVIQTGTRQAGPRGLVLAHIRTEIRQARRVSTDHRFQVDCIATSATGRRWRAIAGGNRLDVPRRCPIEATPYALRQGPIHIEAYRPATHAPVRFAHWGPMRALLHHHAA